MCKLCWYLLTPPPPPIDSANPAIIRIPGDIIWPPSSNGHLRNIAGGRKERRCHFGFGLFIRLQRQREKGMLTMRWAHTHTHTAHKHHEVGVMQDWGRQSHVTKAASQLPEIEGRAGFE